MRDKLDIILFDGECEFCNFWIQFIRKRKKSKNHFKFYAIQSESGKDLLNKHKVDLAIDSIVVIKNNKSFVKSSAAIQIIKSIGGIWNLFLVLWIIPKPIRNWCYDKIAENRHRFFKTNSCEIH